MLKSVRALGRIALVLICTVPLGAWAQQDAQRGFRFHRDTDGHVFAVDYFGSSGLRRAHLAKLPELKRVAVIYGTTITSDDVAYLSSLSNLVEIAIGQETIDPPVTIEGDLLGLENLKSLESVHLCKHDIRDEDLKFIASLPKITHVEFNASGELLDRQYSLTDRCADYLARATTLESVIVQGHGKLTDSFVSRLTAGARDLEHLNMASPKLSDKSLQLLAARCKRLKWLDLGSNGFTDAGVKYLSSAKILEMLWLHSDQLTPACVESIAELKLLKHLGLTVPEITDDQVQILAALSQLEILALRQPVLTDAQFSMFRNHPTLTSAFIDGSNLTEQGVMNTINTIPSLKHLNVGPENLRLQAAVNRTLSQRKSFP